MFVVHIALTSLAGAPIRIVNAINKNSDIKTRLITLRNYPSHIKRTFPCDLIYDTNKEESINIIKQADIIHFHHFFDIEDKNNPFEINFLEYTKDNCKFVRHFHSNLDSIVSWSPNDKELRNRIINDNFPKFVVPHCAERFLLDANIVPNIIPNNDPLLMPIENVNNEKPIVFFSSTSPSTAWEQRWETKGKNEVLKILQKIESEGLCKLVFIEEIPYEECMKEKQKCDIIIGDVVTGSYHLTELEGLSMGKAVLCYLDGRTQLTLTNLTKCDKIPFVNTNIDSLYDTLTFLCQNKKLTKLIGERSRKWIEQYYDDKNLTKIYTQYYDDIINNKVITKPRDEEYEIDDFLNKKVYDLQWEARKKYHTQIINDNQDRNQDIPLKLDFIIQKQDLLQKTLNNTFFKKLKNSINKRLYKLISKL